MNLNFQTALKVLEFLAQLLQLKQLLVGELSWVCLNVLNRNEVVFLQFVVKGLPGNLGADAEHNLHVDDLFFYRSLQDPHVTLAALFNGVLCLVSHDHDLVKMNLVVKEIVELQAFERLEHLLDVFLQGLDQGFVVNFKHVFLEACVFLRYSLLLFVE